MNRLYRTVFRWWNEIEVLIITGATTGKVEANNTAIKNIKGFEALGGLAPEQAGLRNRRRNFSLTSTGASNPCRSHERPLGHGATALSF